MCCRYVKKETKEFFGLDETSEDNQRQRWQDKRKRLASRKYGQLKDQTNTTHHTQSFTSDFHALSEVRGGFRLLIQDDPVLLRLLLLLLLVVVVVVVKIVIEMMIEEYLEKCEKLYAASRNLGRA